MLEKLVVTIAVGLAPALAAAQPAPQPAAVETATTPAPAPAPAPAVATAAPAPYVEPQVRVGAELTLAPTGTIEVAAQGESLQQDTAFAMGFGIVVQRAFTRNVSLDITPRLLLNVKSSDATSSAKELDLRARLTVGGYIAPAARAYAALQPGVSLLMLPHGADSKPWGPTIGLAAGVSFRVAPKLWLTAELGYQFGFQETVVEGTRIDLSTSFLHTAFGVLLDV